jgi:hypothetical protein
LLRTLEESFAFKDFERFFLRALRASKTPADGLF